ncbi:MAG: hypothetical protein DMF62_10485, partial [Acidobacteria bacterium]
MKKSVLYLPTVLFCISTAVAFPLFNLPTNVVGSLAGYFFAPKSTAPDFGNQVMFAGTTYTWNQTGTASWATSTNWTPTRTTPA